MLRRLIFAAGMGYLTRRLMGGGRRMSPGYGGMGIGMRRRGMW